MTWKIEIDSDDCLYQRIKYGKDGMVFNFCANDDNEKAGEPNSCTPENCPLRIERVCEWEEVPFLRYKTKCGNESFTRHGKFCQHCGGKIKIKEGE